MRKLINMCCLTQEQEEEFNNVKIFLRNKYDKDYNLLDLFSKEELVNNICKENLDWEIADEIEQAEIHLEAITEEEAYKRAKKYLMGFEKEFIFNFKIPINTRIQMIIDKAYNLGFEG